MAGGADPWAGIAAPNCPTCLVPMVDVGDAHQVAIADTRAVEGSAWYRCPLCGLNAIA